MNKVTATKGWVSLFVVAVLLTFLYVPELSTALGSPLNVDTVIEGLWNSVALPVMIAVGQGLAAFVLGWLLPQPKFAKPTADKTAPPDKAVPPEVKNGG